ncbi:MAG: hypothetical protein EZS28_001634 [Streblomastix strix]|uniref:Uncharacterized protein n=1 Tax=Streblomastix strix TaxID=222440 RepID=A0A5J4X7X2_9EUKA|nr:MAG: hypothetical protein EZS28_001634 [Streblomastix strix]
MYETNWYNNGDIVPDQITPASDNTPFADSEAGVVGIQNNYAGGDHQHPLQVSSVLPAKDTANCEESVANTYARSDHTHKINLNSSVPLKDTGTGTVGTSNIYDSDSHQHPTNVDPATANVPLVNATAAANCTSDYYCRNDHVHPQQLKYDGNITATKFVKTGGLATEILCINGDAINGVVDLASSQTITGQILFGVDPAQYSREITGQWTASIMINEGLSNESGAANRGLTISADGNTLSFNGSVIAGTGATNGATNGSVNYSAGNPILWGVNSIGTDGGFYSDGEKVFWRAKPITLGSVPP